MSNFQTTRLSEDWDECAPDGSEVRKLLGLNGGSMAHFTFPAGSVSTAELHPAFEEIWYFLEGHGEMWRKSKDREETVEVHSGVAITIPADTIFQIRVRSDAPLRVIGICMPPWSGVESVRSVEGIWEPTIGAWGQEQ